MTSEPGSFARRTIEVRKPQIIADVIADNRYPPDIVAALERFRDEIRSEVVQPLTEEAPDRPLWDRAWAEYRGRTWLELPWYFAETFFYRRLLETIRYFQPGPWQNHDSFEHRKWHQLDEETSALQLYASLLSRAASLNDPALRFDFLLHCALWGNRADLSNRTIAVGVDSAGDTSQREQILIDHTDAVRERLVAPASRRVDFVNDNYGLELLFDMALADFLLTGGWVGEIRFHLKPQPFFVSDAMIKDARHALQLLAQHEDRLLADLGQRLDQHVADRRLQLRDHPFWATCLHFPDMPEDLRAELAAADLVILKGDVNYRRLLEDRHWPHTTRMEDVTAYFPAPFVTLRTLKGEIMVGLEPGQAEALAASDPTWLINGQRGVIQLVTRY